MAEQTIEEIMALWKSMVDTARTHLESLGFVDNGPEELQAISDNIGEWVPQAGVESLSHNGPHVVIAHYIKDGTLHAVIEQNVNPEVQDGVMSTRQHPPCLIIEGPGGRVCTSTLFDTELISELARVHG